MDKLQKFIDIYKKNGTLTALFETVQYITRPLQDPVFRPAINRLYPNGEDMTTKDWDHLIVLDACRADMFEEVIGKVGDNYKRINSNASATPEWINRTFTNKSLGDTVYVTANPWPSREAPDSFHEIVNLWVEETDLTHDEINDIDGNLDDADSVLPPSISAQTVTERAREVASSYPNKRVIVHYFQPHAPYIGKPDGSERDEPIQFNTTNDLRDINREESWQAHAENLAYVWHHAQKYIENVDGKAVVTADHGELFGEILTPFPWRGYFHPRNLHHPLLTTVPYAEFEDSRRDIQDDGCNNVVVDEEANKARLKHLGYLE